MFRTIIPHICRVDPEQHQGGVSVSHPKGLKMVVAFLGNTTATQGALLDASRTQTNPLSTRRKRETAKKGKNVLFVVQIPCLPAKVTAAAASTEVVRLCGVFSGAAPRFVKLCVPERESMNGSSRSGVRGRLLQTPGLHRRVHTSSTIAVQNAQGLDWKLTSLKSKMQALILAARRGDWSVSIISEFHWIEEFFFVHRGRVAFLLSQAMARQWGKAD